MHINYTDTMVIGYCLHSVVFLFIVPGSVANDNQNARNDSKYKLSLYC